MESDAIDRTQKLDRVFLPTEKLEGNLKNPNEMSDAEFNLLCDNVEKMGMTDPILVRPLEHGRFRIVGGHHRWEVAKVLGFKEVPCTVVTDPNFDDDQEQFQVVRMNTIRGKISPQKFINMYLSLSQKYADDILAESFGFATEEEFRKLIHSVKKSLPKELQNEFVKAAEELKTIDDLSKLLNRLFNTYGSTLPFGYMLLDFGGKDSIWLRMNSTTRKAVLTLCSRCVTEKRTLDDIVGGVLRYAAEGKFESEILQLIAESQMVQIPEGTQIPSKEVLEGTMLDQKAS
jgi:hypothetical protein